MIRRRRGVGIEQLVMDTTEQLLERRKLPIGQTMRGARPNPTRTFNDFFPYRLRRRRRADQFATSILPTDMPLDQPISFHPIQDPHQGWRFNHHLACQLGLRQVALQCKPREYLRLPKRDRMRNHFLVKWTIF